MQQEATSVADARRQKLEKMCTDFHEKFKVEEMEPADVKRALDDSEPFVIVDTRNGDEQKVSMIPGAITKAEYNAKEPEFKNHKVVCYCTVGYRSSCFAKELRARGVEAYNMRGSIIGWTQEGLPLVSGEDRSSPATTVHTFSKDWEMQGQGYDAVHYRAAPLRLVMEVVKSKLPKWAA